jgi:hypothetical protein
MRALAGVELNGAYEFNLKKLPKIRTGKQNRSLWLWATHVAEELNTLDMLLEVGAMGIRIEWNKDLVVDHLVRPILKANTGKPSTSRATVKEFLTACEDLQKHMAKEWGVVVDWPRADR